MRVAMGTLVAFEADAASTPLAERAVVAAAAVFERIDALMHPTNVAGDLARIAAHEVGRALAVDAWTFEVLDIAKRVHDVSGGLFDPCVPEAPGTFADLHLLPPNSVVSRARIGLDLGGIAKGFAVDKAIAAMLDAGCSGGLVNAGGDLRVFGLAPVVIGCRGPSGEWLSVQLKNSALAVSHHASGGRPSEHRGYYDRRHGRSGAVEPGAAPAAAVGAPTAALADALTKCLLLSGPDQCERLLRRFDARRLF